MLTTIREPAALRSVPLMRVIVFAPQEIARKCDRFVMFEKRLTRERSVKRSKSFLRLRSVQRLILAAGNIASNSMAKLETKYRVTKVDMEPPSVARRRESGNCGFIGDGSRVSKEAV